MSRLISLPPSCIQLIFEVNEMRNNESWSGLMDSDYSNNTTMFQHTDEVPESMVD